MNNANVEAMVVSLPALVQIILWVVGIAGVVFGMRYQILRNKEKMAEIRAEHMEKHMVVTKKIEDVNHDFKEREEKIYNTIKEIRNEQKDSSKNIYSKMDNMQDSIGKILVQNAELIGYFKGKKEKEAE